MSGRSDQFAERLALAEDELGRLDGRLRALSQGAWRSRRAPVLAGLGRLAALSAQVEGRPTPSPPEPADFALADALVVVAGDLMATLAVTPDDVVLSVVLSELRAILIATR